MDNSPQSQSLRTTKATKIAANSFTRHISYNVALGIAITLPMLAVGVFNWAIDPQDIFDTPNYLGLNHQKVKKDNNDRLYKATDIIRLQPTTLIMGSSRTKQGINPDSPWLSDRESIYNLALNGPNFYEIKEYIEHALYVQPDLQEIILGVDFFMFNQDLANQPTFKASRLNTNWYSMGDLATYLFSVDAITSSWQTIQASRQIPELATKTQGENGFLPNRNSQDGENIWRFHQSIKLYYQLHSDYEFSESYWADFQEIVSLCQENQIKLTVFISPAHASHWEAIRLTGRWAIFEQWKKDLTAMVPVWDFSGYNSITSEKIAKSMENYVDNSHYTPQIGEMILQRIFGNSADNIPSDFGVLLTPQNLNQHLEQINRDRKQWRINNPEEAEMVENFYRERKTN